MGSQGERIRYRRVKSVREGGVQGQVEKYLRKETTRDGRTSLNPT